jgi:Osmolarity sensor protein envZ (EC 2.7.3.-)
MNEDVLVDRQYSHGVALTLRAYWAADEENRDKIAEAAGLIRVTGSGVPEGEQHWPTARSTSGRCRPSWVKTPRCACASMRRRRYG